jgi:hypothetical protein
MCYPEYEDGIRPFAHDGGFHRYHAMLGLEAALHVCLEEAALAWS